MQLLLQLSNNLAYMLALTFISGLLTPFLSHYSSLGRSLIRGVLFGLFGITVMLNTIQVVSGFFIDGRSIVILMAGMFGGTIPAVISSVFVLLYRVSLGGGGVIPSFFSALTCVVLGVWIYHQRRTRSLKLKLPLLFFLGIVTLLQHLFWTSLFIGSLGGQYIQITLVPALVIYPLGTSLMGLLLYRQERQEQIEAALQESEERYRLIVNTMNDGIAILDSSGTITSCNPSAERILGFKANQLVGKSLFDPGWQAVHEDGSPFLRDTYPGVITLQSGEVQSKIVLGVEKPDQTIAWIEISTYPLWLSASHVPRAVFATFTDVTERRRAQEKLRQERDLLRTLIDSSPDYIFIKDADGRFVVTNFAHAQAVKLNPADLVGKTAFDVFPPDLAAQYHADDEQIMASGKPLINVERNTLDAAGKSRTVLTSKIPLRNSDGENIGLVGISRDITERKQYEIQSLELSAERERANVLQRFISDMSHDFRTPLSIISSSLYLIKKNTDPQKQLVHMEKMEHQVLRLSKLLDSVLQMANLDRHNVRFQFASTDLNELVKHVLDDVEETFAVAQVTVTFHPQTTPCLADVDQVEVARALIHLLENAVTYTDPGGSVSLHTHNQNDLAIISVQDSGIGIAPDDQQHIFERFYRVDQARSTFTGGNGLGLSIVQTIVDAHGGRIEVDSAVGQGSTFTLIFPVRHTSDIPPTDSASTSRASESGYV